MRKTIICAILGTSEEERGMQVQCTCVIHVCIAGPKTAFNTYGAAWLQGKLSTCYTCKITEQAGSHNVPGELWYMVHHI